MGYRETAPFQVLAYIKCRVAFDMCRGFMQALPFVFVSLMTMNGSVFAIFCASAAEYVFDRAQWREKIYF